MYYGWLRRIRGLRSKEYGWTPIGDGIATIADTYGYGHPTDTSGTAGGGTVSLQFLFDESSGNIVDEANSVTLTANGTPDYSVAAASPWSLITPGIKLNDVVSDWFSKTTATAQADLTTNGVIEFVVSLDAFGVAEYMLFNTYNGTDGYQAGIQTGASDGRISYYIEASDGTVVSGVLGNNLNDTMTDNLLHKFRFVFDLDGNLEIFFEGSSLGTASLTTLSGKSVLGNRLDLGSNQVAGVLYHGNFASFRLTQGTTTANNGGPGGG